MTVQPNPLRVTRKPISNGVYVIANADTNTCIELVTGADGKDKIQGSAISLRDPAVKTRTWTFQEDAATSTDIKPVWRIGLGESPKWLSVENGALVITDAIDNINAKWEVSGFAFPDSQVWYYELTHRASRVTLSVAEEKDSNGKVKKDADGFINKDGTKIRTFKFTPDPNRTDLQRFEGPKEPWVLISLN